MGKAVRERILTGKIYISEWQFKTHDIEFTSRKKFENLKYFFILILAS